MDFPRWCLWQTKLPLIRSVVGALITAKTLFIATIVAVFVASVVATLMPDVLTTRNIFALILLVTFSAIVATLHPRVRTLGEKHKFSFNAAYGVLAALAGVFSTLLVTDIMETSQKSRRQVILMNSVLSDLRNVEKSIASYLYKLPKTNDDLLKLFAMCSRYKKTGIRFGRYSGIIPPVVPSRAYRLVTENISPDFLEMEFFDELTDSLESINQRYKTDLKDICQPNHLAAFGFVKFQIQKAKFLAETQLDILLGRVPPPNEKFLKNVKTQVLQLWCTNLESSRKRWPPILSREAKRDPRCGK